MHLKTDVWLYISAAVSQKKCMDVNDHYLLCLYNVLSYYVMHKITEMQVLSQFYCCAECYSFSSVCIVEGESAM